MMNVQLAMFSMLELISSTESFFRMIKDKTIFVIINFSVLSYLGKS